MTFMRSSGSFLPQPTYTSRYNHAYDYLERAQDFAGANNLVKALDQYNAAIGIFERLKKQLNYKHPLYRKVIKSLTACYRGKTQYYEQQGLVRSALEQNILACETFNHLGFSAVDNDYREYARLAFNSVRLCAQLNDTGGAVEYGLDGIAALKNIHKTERKDCDHRLIAYYYNGIGKLYFNYGSIQKACHYFNKADVSLMRMTNPTTKDVNALKETFGKLASFFQSKTVVQNSKKYEAKFLKYQDLSLTREKDQIGFFSPVPDTKPTIHTEVHYRDQKTSKSRK